jgi:hypothetical protein
VPASVSALLSRALQVTEYRPRRASRLPVIDVRGEPTRPNVRVSHGGPHTGG